MRTSANILFCIIVLTLSACGGGSFEKRLSALDSVLKDKPDSVYELLLGMEEEAIMQKKSNRMYYELMRADAQNKAYVDFTTDSVMKIVADYYDRHGSANEQMRAHYLLGCTYRDLKDVPMELQCFQDAVEKADTTKKDCDWGRMASIYGQMANIYHYQYLPEEELKALGKCEHFSIQNHDDYGSIKAYELRMRAYLTMNMPDTVLDITNRSRELYNEIGCQKEAARLLGPAIAIFIDRERFTEAEALMDIFEKESEVYNNKGKIEYNTIIYYYYKGQMALYHNNISLARNCFTRLLDDEKEAAYKGFLLLYEKIGNPDSIAKYAKLYAAANDSNFLGKNAQTIEQMTAMYNYGLQKQIADKTAIENERIKNNNYILLIIIILLVSGGTVIAMILSNKHKEQQRKKAEELELLAKRYNATKSQLVKAEEEKSDLLERMKTIPSESEIMEYEEKVAELQKRINTLSNTMMSYKQIDADIDATAWFHSFKSDDIVIRFLEHLSSHNHNHNYIAPEEEWESLVDHFKNEARGYYDFITSRENNLSPLDIRVCMLSTLGFHTNEIANILDKSGQHITNVRKRIRERLSLSTDNSQKLDKALQAKLYSFIKK